MVTISYAITVKDEVEEFQRLLELLDKKIDPADEIIILFDQKNGDSKIISFLQNFKSDKQIRYHKGDFDNHFANWKNTLSEYCSKEYIFQIDADEFPNELLLENLRDILDENSIDVYLVPRINTVEGITPEHIKKWGWRIDNNGWINYPDYQWRIYKNTPTIRWKNKVHEVLTGFKTYTTIPSYEELSLYHPKNIERQVSQNKFYDQI